MLHTLYCDGYDGEYLFYCLMFLVGISEGSSTLASVSWRMDVTTSIITGFTFAGLPQKIYQQVILGAIDVSDPVIMRNLLLKLWVFNLVIVVIYLVLILIDIFYLIPNPNADYKFFGDCKILMETVKNLHYVKYPIILTILMESGFYLFYPSIGNTIAHLVIFSIDSYTKDNYEWRSTLLNLVQSVVVVVVSLMFLMWDIFEPEKLQREGFPAYKNHMQFINLKGNWVWLALAVAMFTLRSFFGLAFIFSYSFPNNSFLNYLKTYHNLFPIVLFMGVTRAYGSNFSTGNCFGLMLQHLLLDTLTTSNNTIVDKLGSLKDASISTDGNTELQTAFNNSKTKFTSAHTTYSGVSTNSSNTTDLTSQAIELEQHLIQIIEAGGSVGTDSSNKAIVDNAKELYSAINKLTNISYKSTQLLFFIMIYSLLYFAEFQNRFLKTHLEIRGSKEINGYHFTDKYGGFKMFWWWIYRVPVLSSIRLVWPFYTS